MGIVLIIPTFWKSRSHFVSHEVERQFVSHKVESQFVSHEVESQCHVPAEFKGIMDTS